MEEIISAATKANIHHFIQQLPQVEQNKMTLSIDHYCMLFVGL